MDSRTLGAVCAIASGFCAVISIVLTVVSMPQQKTAAPMVLTASIVLGALGIGFTLVSQAKQ